MFRLELPVAKADPTTADDNVVPSSLMQSEEDEVEGTESESYYGKEETQVYEDSMMDVYGAEPQRMVSWQV
jgi:hypothetical protein